MRKTDIIAKEKFNGDISKAIEYIIHNFKSKDLDDICEEWTDNECLIARKVVKQMAIEQYGKEETEQMFSLVEENPTTLNLSNSDVINAKKNPYKAKLGKDFLKLILVNGGIIALISSLSSMGISVENSMMDVVRTISSVFTTCVAMDAGANLINYFKFKKENNVLNNDNLENVNKGGKSL